MSTDPREPRDFFDRVTRRTRPRREQATGRLDQAKEEPLTTHAEGWRWCMWCGATDHGVETCPRKASGELKKGNATVIDRRPKYGIRGAKVRGAQLTRRRLQKEEAAKRAKAKIDKRSWNAVAKAARASALRKRPTK